MFSVRVCLLAVIATAVRAEMASIAPAQEPGISPGSMPLADALVPASIFAPDRGGYGDDPGDECFEDGYMVNGEPQDRAVDFTSKVKLRPLWRRKANVSSL